MLRAIYSLALVIATAVGCGSAQAASAEFESLFARILQTPDDPALNADFADLAEQEGELRLALAALERAVRADPGNADYALRFVRVRNLLSPAKTVITYDFGISYESNPRLRPDNIPADTSRFQIAYFGGPFDGARTQDATFDAGATIVDERSFGGLRWRSFGGVRGQVLANADELGYGSISGWTGPLFWLTPELSLNLAPGGAAEMVDDRFRGWEASGKATFTTPMGGIPQFLELYGGYRDYQEQRLSTTVAAQLENELKGLPAVLSSHLEKLSNDGWFAQATARLTTQPKIVSGDRFVVQPYVRIVWPDESGYSTADLAAAARPLFIFPFNPTNKVLVGEERHAGISASYTFPVVARFAYLGVGLAYTHSSFDQTVSVSNADLSLDRISPFAQLVFPDLIAKDVDLRFDYRFDHQTSNEPTLNYDDHVVGIRVTGRM